MPTKRIEIEELILELLNERSEVSIRSIAKAANIEIDETGRRKIRRALLSLVSRNRIIPTGAGRSRAYVLYGQKHEEDKPSKGQEPVSSDDGSGLFDGIKLSAASRKVLKYVTQKTNLRAPVGYDQEFLRSYEPNSTFYLSSDQRETLLAMGQVEAAERPAGTYARNILDRLLIDLSWNSSRLEGNTYSLLETKRLIELGERASGKDASETQMILNHKAAIEYIVESSQDKLITSLDIRSVHALLSENLLGDAAASGRLRTIAVGIGGTPYLPLENPQTLHECFDLFVEKLNRISDPFEQSLFSVVHLSYLQPFEDVNKRTARLVANIPLIEKNLRPLSFMEVEKDAYVSALLGVYEKNDISLIRDLYLWAYHRSSQRYTAVQRSMGEQDQLKLKNRDVIKEVVRTIILERLSGESIDEKIRSLIESKNVPAADREALSNLIETEVISLHEGNAARFRVRPSEFQIWKDLQ